MTNLALIFATLSLLVSVFVAWQFLSFKARLESLLKLDKGGLDKTFQKLLLKLKDQEEEIKFFREKQAEFEKKQKNCFSKLGLVRFNPFASLGGDQSFTISLLDENDNGLIINSLHAREATRIYAKIIKAGQTAGINFSPEEKQAILEAKKKK